MTTVVPIEQRNTVVVEDIEHVVVVEDTDKVVVVTNSVINVGTPQDLSGYYTKSETDGLLAGKANAVHNHVVNDITDFTVALINGGSF